MSEVKIDARSNNLVIAPTRKRETPQPTVTFRKVMESGAQVLLSGARLATHLVGGPALAAAIPSGGTSSDGASALSSSGKEAEMLQTMQQQRYGEELKLIELQDQIQRHNRQISLVSNLLKAQHETAKAAISNLRS